MAPIKLASIYLSVVVWMSITGESSSFILDSQTCLAFPPCTCSNNYVYCQGKGLSTLPTFEVSNVTGSYIYLYLSGNQFTTIPANSFDNLTVSNDTNVHLELNNNHLNSIETHAFTGIADTVYTLYLEGNNFTTVPTELKSLSKLQNLYLRNNPISSLNPSTMHSLGRHLKSFNVDLNHFSTWPKELNLLTSLTGLNVGYINMTHLDYDVFDGFVNTLHALSMEYTQLEKIPIAVCHLHNLQSLTFRYNDNVHVNNTVFEPCSRKLTSVTSVTLTGNKLIYMPDVFRSFPSMTQLYINTNQLSYIHWDTIPGNHPLTYLNMDDNELTRIPTAINKLHSLSQLSINSNKITSVEDSDLNNLSRLQYLYLNFNPIRYISPHAFKNNLALYDLYLQNTNLRQLPSSIAGLHNLRTLYLYGSPIECDCDMSFLKPLTVTIINMNGNCKVSSIPIKTYLKDDLPNCP